MQINKFVTIRDKCFRRFSVIELSKIPENKKREKIEMFDPTEWMNSFPIIAKLAIKLFDICASTAAVEQCHSQTKRLLTPQRTRMGPELMNRLRFITVNMPIFYPDLYNQTNDETNEDSYESEEDSY